MNVRYKILLNVEKDSQGRNVGFFGYKPEHQMEVSYEGTLDVSEKDSPFEDCDRLFEMFNINHPQDYRNRSLSIGDVITLEYQTSQFNSPSGAYFAPRAFSVDSVGFTEIPTSGIVL